MSGATTTPGSNPVTRGALLFLLSLAYLFLHVKVLWRIGDEGTLVYGAQLVAQGALPYRDFFEVMGPASFYWLGLFFKLFGANILVARGVLLLTGALTILLIYWMTRRIYRGPFDVLPGVFFLVICFPIWPGTNHHWDSNLFALLTVATFFLWQERRRWWLLALAGVLAGLTSCFIQQKGVLLVLSLALAIWGTAHRAGPAKSRIASQLGILLAGFAGVGGAVLLFFYLSGGLPDLLYANLIWPLTRYHQINQVPYGFNLIYPNLQPVFPFPLGQVMTLLVALPLYIILCLPFLLLGLAGVCCFQKSNRTRIFNAVTLPYWTAGFALWISELHRKDIMHLVYGSPLLLILLFLTWNYCFEGRRVLKVIGLGLLTFCIILHGSFYTLAAAHARQQIATRRGVLYGFKPDTALKFLMDQTKPGDYVFVYPYYPMYYFLADVKNPTRYSILLYNINTEDQFEEVINNLKQKQVKYVLWDNMTAGSNLVNWFPRYEHPPQKDLHLERYLESHYEVIEVQNDFKILRLREDALTD
jgi:4-amino-4-deoxy-L-arabinose transferase-like glycosyltransferase